MKTDRIEARVSADERARMERAAAIAGVSLSAFTVGAAVQRANEVIAEATTTTVSADYFDALLAELDVPSPAPKLAEVARRKTRIERSTAR